MGSKYLWAVSNLLKGVLMESAKIRFEGPKRALVVHPCQAWLTTNTNTVAMVRHDGLNMGVESVDVEVPFENNDMVLESICRCGSDGGFGVGMHGGAGVR